MKRETKKSLFNLTICVNYLTTVAVSTDTQVESQAVESDTTAVESVVVVSVFSDPEVQDAKKIVADAKSMNVIFFIIVFVCFFCKLFVLFCKLFVDYFRCYISKLLFVVLIKYFFNI